MRIDVNFDLSLLDREAKRYEKNLAFSTAQAINDAALEAQRRIRESLKRNFHLRKTDFMFRAVKIFAFANVGANRPFAELGIDNKPRLMLSLYETGGARLPFKGASVAVPITGSAARPSMDAPVSDAFKFQSLNFRRAGPTAAGRAVLAARRAKHIHKRKLSGSYYYWQGDNRTFILSHTARSPFGGVFQRTGPKRDDIRLIYSFRRGVEIRKALDFIETSRETYQEVFADAFVRRFYRLNT